MHLLEYSNSRNISIIPVVLIFQIWSYEIWQFSLPGGISAGVMFEILLYVSALVSNLPVILYNIYVSYRDKTGHMRSFGEAVRPLVPLFLLFAITTLWVAASPNDILRKEPRAIYFLTGTIFSNISVSGSLAPVRAVRWVFSAASSWRR